MKNDKLFDMLEEFKVDDEYIDEALTGSSDSRGTKVYAGKTRPMKIIAPIAAALAVFAAAGIVFANRDKLPINNGALSPASSSEESENNNTESTENSNTESTWQGQTYTDHTLELWGWSVPSQTEYVDKCVDIVMGMYSDKLQGDVTWQAGEMDIEFDGWGYELVVCPQINGKSVKGVGACIFKKYSASNDPAYVGSFGSDFDTIDLDDIQMIYNYDEKIAYYFSCNEEYEKCTDTLQRLWLDNNAVHDETYLRLVKTYPDNASSDTPYTETAYRYGEKISTEQLLSEWRSVQDLTKGVILPTPNTSSDAHLGKQECVQLLIDKYNVPVSANSFHRVIYYIDVNNDGVDETVIEFRNCKQLRGMYVFSSDGKLIGEFDLEGYRYRGYAIGSIDTISRRFSAGIFPFDDNGKNSYGFRTFRTGESALKIWAIDEAYRIVVNEDGTLSAEKALEADYGSEVFKINGEEVSYDEYRTGINKFAKNSPSIYRPFVW